MNKIIAWWNTKFKGARNAHKVGFADKGMKAQLLSGDLGKQALVEIREQARNDICVGMRVPKVLLDIQGATFANAAEGRKFLLEDTVIPRAKYYADVINEDLVDRIDPSVVFEFATDELEILQEDATAKWSRLASAINAGAITPEFARQEMGWPETAAPEIQDKPLTPEQDALRAWRRRSLKALRSGNSPAVPDDSRFVRPTIRAAISAQLAGAKTSADVLGVFDGMR
jgi:phage portal protein BeeE